MNVLRRARKNPRESTPKALLLRSGSSVVGDNMATPSRPSEIGSSTEKVFDEVLKAQDAAAARQEVVVTLNYGPTLRAGAKGCKYPYKTIRIQPLIKRLNSLAEEFNGDEDSSVQVNVNLVRIETLHSLQVLVNGAGVIDLDFARADMGNPSFLDKVVDQIERQLFNEVSLVGKGNTRLQLEITQAALDIENNEDM